MTDVVPATTSTVSDLTMLKLAREIAMDIRELPAILESHRVTDAEWEKISTNTRFQEYLSTCTQEWESATNTQERVKLKSLAFIEESLPEFYTRAHDPQENLSAKTEVLKTVARFAGVGVNVEGVTTGDRLTVTINLGADSKLQFDRGPAPAIIEGTLNE